MLCFIIANEERDELSDTINSVVVSQRVSGGGEQKRATDASIKINMVVN